MIDKATQRASHADRERTAAHLGVALSEGRLGVAEYEDRIAKTYAALTYGELEPLTTDVQYAVVPQFVVQSPARITKPEVSVPKPVGNPPRTTAPSDRLNPWEYVLLGVMVSLVLNLIGVIVSWAIAGTPTAVTVVCGLLFAAAVPFGDFVCNRADALDMKRKRANAYNRRG